jgi:hypothetical protein
VFLKDDARREIVAAQSDLAVCIEFYLCGVFRLVPVAQSHGWWCDGVIELSIEKLNRTSFLIAGAAYCENSAAGFLAPFEIEFHFAKRRDPGPARIIVRFGELDHHGSIRTTQENPTVIAASRPTQDRDWVIAVELTPEPS